MILKEFKHGQFWCSQNQSRPDNLVPSGMGFNGSDSVHPSVSFSLDIVLSWFYTLMLYNIVFTDVG